MSNDLLRLYILAAKWEKSDVRNFREAKRQSRRAISKFPLNWTK